jgi:hypothetical protein
MHRITAAVDGLYKMNRDYADEQTLKPAGGAWKAFGGLEYALLYEDFEVAIRGGGNVAQISTLDTYTFSAGAGFRWLGYALQYAFMGETDRTIALGYGHRISLILELDRLFPGQRAMNTAEEVE